MNQENPRRTFIRRLLAMKLLQKAAGSESDGYWCKVDKLYLFALVPVVLFGIWNIGFQTTRVMQMTNTFDLSGWQSHLFFRMVWQEFAILEHFLLGSVYFFPLFVVCLLSCFFWDKLFAHFRNTQTNGGNYLISVLFVLLLPSTMPLVFAVIGVSFGIVFGKLVFAGNGRYLVSPPLLGVLFLYYSYPGFFNGATSFLPIAFTNIQSSWLTIVETGSPAFVDSGQSWLAVFGGNQVGAIGTNSALLSLIALIYFIKTRLLSWIIPIGTITGLIMANLLVSLLSNSQLPVINWYWHLVIGNFLFCLAFIASDPTVAPISRGGLFFYGWLFGFVTLVIRMLNPNHPEATLLALMLASLFIPLFDWLAIAFHRQFNNRRKNSGKSNPGKNNPGKTNSDNTISGELTNKKGELI